MICQANRKIHLLIAASLWFLIGLLLLVKALIFSSNSINFLFFSLGLAFSLLFFARIFLKLVSKNILRLQENNYKCIFAFQSFKSYLIVLLMITLGIIINHFKIMGNSIIFIYSAVGCSLIIGSLKYFITLRKEKCGLKKK